MLDKKGNSRHTKSRKETDLFKRRTRHGCPCIACYLSIFSFTLMDALFYSCVSLSLTGRTFKRGSPRIISITSLVNVVNMSFEISDLFPLVSFLAGGDFGNLYHEQTFKSCFQHPSSLYTFADHFKDEDK
jgi:hypothetical protein